MANGNKGYITHQLRQSTARIEKRLFSGFFLSGSGVRGNVVWQYLEIFWAATSSREKRAVSDI